MGLGTARSLRGRHCVFLKTVVHTSTFLSSDPTIVKKSVPTNTTMLASANTLTALLMFSILIITSTASAQNTPRNPTAQEAIQQHQQPILAPPSFPPAPTTLATITTTTRYVFETHTAVRTRYVADGSTAMPSAVRKWHRYKDAEKEGIVVGCDHKACEGCRVWYWCGEGGR